MQALSELNYEICQNNNGISINTLLTFPPNKFLRMCDIYLIQEIYERLKNCISQNYD